MATDARWTSECTPIAETLEPRLMLSTVQLISPGGDHTVDAGLTVTVDSYGAFGSSASPADDAYFNPPGAATSSGTMFESAVFFGMVGQGTFLAEGSIGSTGNLGGVDNTGTSPTDANSEFVHQGITFALTQAVTDMTEGTTKVGSMLTQTYHMTNDSGSSKSFYLIRYIDGDLYFDGTLQDSGGASTMDAVMEQELFEFDSGDDPSSPSTYVGMTATGGTVPAAYYEIDQYADLLDRINSLQPLRNTIYGDPDNDGLVLDTYDITLALGREFTLAAGESADFVTETKFGYGSPSSVIQLPGITVTGNAVPISDGDTTPASFDGTDFGITEQGQPGPTQDFVVENTGTGDLILGNVIVPIGYTLVEGLSATLATGATDTFTVQLDTTTSGVKAGDITFSTNVSGKNPFNFRVTGEVLIPGPEVAVEFNENDIVDNSAIPSTELGTDFGIVAQGAAGITHDFLVKNLGNEDLELGEVTVPEGYTLVEPLSTTLTPGTSDTFTVQLDTAVLGVKSGEITFDTNDDDEDPFNFFITGEVLPPPEITVSAFSTEIVDGQANPDEVDFGDIPHWGENSVVIFTVTNEGGYPLLCGNVDFPIGYILEEGLSASIAPGESDTFTVQLTSDIVGVKSGEISFATNDDDENPFNFEITGEVTPIPQEITVIHDTKPLEDEQVHPVDLGSYEVGSDSDLVSFTVQNDGDADLAIDSVGVTGDFIIVQDPSGTLAAGEWALLKIRVDTTTAGAKTGTVTIDNDDADEDPFTFDVTGNVFSPPDAVDDPDATMDEDSGPLNIDVLANDTNAPDPAGPLLVTGITQGTDGTVTIAPDGLSVNYDPDLHFNGTDTFTYTITDEDGLEDTATVTVTVAPVNDQPTADDQSVTTDEDVPIDITLVGADIETVLGTLVFTEATPPLHGGVTIVGNVATYTPDPHYHGPDSFTFTVTDDGDLSGSHANPGDLTSTEATVTITVAPINDEPIATADAVTVDEDDSVVITLAGTDVETPVGELVFALDDLPDHGTAVLVGNEVTYTPTGNYNGPDSFTFTVTDSGDPSGSHANPGDLTSPASAVTITVDPINDVPTSAAQTAMTDMEVPVTLDLFGDDLETAHANLTYNITVPPVNGTLTPDGGVNGRFLYTPDTNFVGTETFEYTVTDDGDPSGSVANAETSASSTVTVRVGHEVLADGRNEAHSYDDTGDYVKVQLRGPGTFKLQFPHAGWADIQNLILTGTTAQSQLIITCAGTTSLFNLTSDGSMKDITAKTTSVRGDVAITGTVVGTMAFDDVMGDHQITIGAGVTPVTLIFDRLADVEIVSLTPIKSLLCSEWLQVDGVDLVVDSLTAPYILSAKAKPSWSSTASGNWEADVTATGSDAKGVAVGLLEATGDLATVDVLAANGRTGTVRGRNWSVGSLTTQWVQKIETKQDWRTKTGGNMTAVDVTTTGQSPSTWSPYSLQDAKIGGDLTGGTWNIGDDPQEGNVNTIKAANVTGLTLNATGYVKTLEATNTLNAAATAWWFGKVKGFETAGTVNADWITRMETRRVWGAPAGNWGAAVTITGTGAPRNVALGTCMIYGNLDAAIAVGAPADGIVTHATSITVSGLLNDAMVVYGSVQRGVKIGDRLQATEFAPGQTNTLMVEGTARVTSLNAINRWTSQTITNDELFPNHL